MFKKVLVLLLVMLMFTACGDSSIDIKKNYEFEFELLPDEESLYSMIFDPVTGAKTYALYKVNIPEPYDANYVSENEVDATYIIEDYYTNVVYANIRVNTAPVDMEEYFDTDDPTRINELMVSQFFPAMEVYEGLRKNVVEDFGYELLVDWTGTAYGLDAFYLEFFDEETGNHAMRFYFSNNEMNDEFYAFEFKADIPLEEKDRIDLMRDIIFTLKKS